MTRQFWPVNQQVGLFNTLLAVDNLSDSHELGGVVRAAVVDRRDRVAARGLVDRAAADLGPRVDGCRAGARAVSELCEGVGIITLQKLVEREYTIPQPQTAEEVISYSAKRLAQDVKTSLAVCSAGSKSGSSCAPERSESLLSIPWFARTEVFRQNW